MADSNPTVFNALKVKEFLGLTNLTVAPTITTNRLYLLNGTLTFSGSAVSGAGAGGTPTWEQIFALDTTFAISSGTMTITQSSANALLTLSKTNVGAGAVLDLSNSGTGADIKNGSAYSLLVSGGVGVLNLGSAGSINATDGALTIGKTGTATTLLGTLTVAEAVTFTSGGVTVTSGNVLVSSGNLTLSAGQTSLISASNAASSLLVTNNTATTYGIGGTSTGVVLVRSISLTTGTLARLQLTEATLNGGFYLDCWDVTAGAAVFSVAEDGVTLISGVEGSNVFTITAGDVVFTLGSLTITDNDDAASFAITNNTLTTASMFTIGSSSMTTGHALDITANAASTTTGAVRLSVTGLTTGSAVLITSSTANFTTGGKMIELAMVAATAGNGLSVVTTGAYTGTGLIIVSAGAMTTGVMLSLTSTTGLTSGSIIRATTSTAGAIATNGAFSFTGTGIFTSGSALLGMFNVSATATVAGTIMNVSGGALTTGVALSVDDPGTGITSGSLIRVATATTGAVATNGVVSVRATGAFTSTANVGLVDVLASAVTGTATVMRVKSSAAGQTAVEVMRVEAAGYTTGYSGVVMNVVGVATTGAASTTHSVLKLTGANTTGGNILQLTNNALTTGVGIIYAHTTSVIADTGSMLRLSSSGVNTGGATNGTILDIGNTGSTAATVALITDTSTLTGLVLGISHTTGVLASGGSLLRLTSTSVDTGTTTGTMLDIAATAATTAVLGLITSATLTTGVGISMVLNGLTSGNGLRITSSSADTTARGLIQLSSSSTSATGASAIRFTMALMSSHFRRFATDSNTGVTLWFGDGTTANAALAATTGDFIINAGSNKPEYCTNGGGSLWTAVV